jgi:hypothetical protein
MQSKATTFGNDSGGARSVARARPTVCVVCRPAPTSRNDSAAPNLAEHDRAVGIAGQHDQRELHNRQAAELYQRAHPDVGDAAPPQHGTMRIGTKSHQGTKRREHQGQRDHHRDEPRRYPKFHDHDPIQSADQQHDREADQNLEQRQPQQATQRQLGRRRIGERQEPRADVGPGPRQFRSYGTHWRTTSSAWGM